MTEKGKGPNHQKLVTGWVKMVMQTAVKEKVVLFCVILAKLEIHFRIPLPIWLCVRFSSGLETCERFGEWNEALALMLWRWSWLLVRKWGKGVIERAAVSLSTLSLVGPAVLHICLATTRGPPANSQRQLLGPGHFCGLLQSPLWLAPLSRFPSSSDVSTIPVLLPCHVLRDLPDSPALLSGPLFLQLSFSSCSQQAYVFQLKRWVLKFIQSCKRCIVVKIALKKIKVGRLTPICFQDLL